MPRKKPRKQEYRKYAYPKRMAVLDQAKLDVADREDSYGDPLENHARIAVLVSSYNSCKSIGSPITPVDMVAYEILKNLARLVETPGHKGSWDNIAGYAAIGYEVTNP